MTKRGGRLGHTHVYAPHPNPEWGGFVCWVCGFRIPGNLEKAAKSAGAKFEPPAGGSDK